MTPARANRMNRTVFFVVVTYILVACAGVAFGDRGILQSAAQALAVVPFAVIFAVLGLTAIAMIVSIAISGIFSTLGLIAMLACLLVGRKGAALTVSKRIDLLEQRIADRILPRKEEHD